MIELFSRQEDTDLVLLKCENQKPYSLRQAGKGTFYFMLVEPAVLSGSIFLCSMPGCIFHCHFTCQGCGGVLSHQYLQTPSWPGCESARCCERVGTAWGHFPGQLKQKWQIPLLLCFEGFADGWWSCRLLVFTLCQMIRAPKFSLSCGDVTCPVACHKIIDLSLKANKSISFKANP